MHYESLKKMSQRKKEIKTPLINCKWNNCIKEYSNDWDLNEHIKSHLATIKPEQDGTFSCLWGTCDFITKCHTEFQRHSYYHGYYTALLNRGQYECETNPHIPRCNYTARKDDTIMEINNNYTCDWTDCERTFVSIVEFQDHVVQHACFEYEMEKSPDDEKPKIQCNWNFCKKQLDNRYRLIEHIQTHTNKKQAACPHCGALFRNRTTLFDHLRRQPDNNTKQFQCAQCFKFFATETLLRSHMVKHVYCYKCNMCDMTCSSASALTLHIRYRHLKDKPFKCTECNYNCVRECDLNQHIQLIHSKEVYNCDELGCSYSVRTKQALRKHVLEVHENTPYIYMCHCCDKPFKNGKSLSMHLKKKHDYKLPSGHKRFTYRIDENGFYRLEMTRIESLEVTEQILTPNTIEMADVTSNTDCYEIVSKTTNSNHNSKRIVLKDDTATDVVVEVVISLPTLNNDSN